MNNEKEQKNSINKFELEGNVGSINDVYKNQNGKLSLRFDLCQNNNGNTQFVPIVIKGDLVNTYGEVIQKGDWISIKGKILSYEREVVSDSKSFKNKVIEILGFEVTDKKNKKVYTYDGKINDLNNNELER